MAAAAPMVGLIPGRVIDHSDAHVPAFPDTPERCPRLPFMLFRRNLFPLRRLNGTFSIFIVSLYEKFVSTSFFIYYGAMPGQKDFYEIQSLQWRKSLFVFTALIVFYFVAVGLISLAVVLSLGFFGAGRGFWTSPFIYKLLVFDLLASTLIAWFHFQDARRFGAGYILKRLDARPPDPSDRYHKQFLNTLDEVRIAAGVPKVNAYVIPAFAVNSMALVEADRTPAVAITEGLLAECTRDELQAVAAHELAHIARGDAFYVTLVCSLANFFEKLKEALEPEQTRASARPPGAEEPRRGRRPGAHLCRRRHFIRRHAPLEHADQPGAGTPGRRRGRGVREGPLLPGQGHL